MFDEPSFPRAPTFILSLRGMRVGVRTRLGVGMLLGVGMQVGVGMRVGVGMAWAVHRFLLGFPSRAAADDGVGRTGVTAGSPLAMLGASMTGIAEGEPTRPQLRHPVTIGTWRVPRLDVECETSEFRSLLRYPWTRRDRDSVRAVELLVPDIRMFHGGGSGWQVEVVGSGRRGADRAQRAAQRVEVSCGP